MLPNLSSAAVVIGALRINLTRRTYKFIYVSHYRYMGHGQFGHRGMVGQISPGSNKHATK